ncbi:unnamed protein product [Notodromas monacha]|uniref:HEAT repeat-containing protein 1 n=1 Tax=Notodromas monacha TaxID=399045 RepID=A0A7R9GBT8_9CRUS|nr:unnamed protein product [Notodromas monacha]CAG0916878.1 unnamed protein product [Notodromas monacha]
MAQSVLAAQLSKLRAPQTSVYRESTRRVSILFDHKQAASIDGKTCYEIGVNGFNRLVDVDSGFKAFSTSLFSSSTQDFVRSVQRSDINSELDVVINEFLLRLSPYLLLQPALEALEWLIFKFEIHVYNGDALLSCFLPHHDTPLFARGLQVLQQVCSDPSQDFHWLNKYRQSGTPVPKGDLYRKCAQNPGIIAFIGRAVISTTKIFQKSTNNKLIVGLYVQCVAGSIESCKSVPHSMVVVLLPFILKGLSNENEEFRKAAHFVLAHVMLKTKLQESFVYDVLNRYIDLMGKEVTVHDLSILYVISAGQNLKSFPLESVQKLMASTKKVLSFGDALQKAQEEENLPVLAIIKPLLDTLLTTDGRSIVVRVKSLLGMLERLSNFSLHEDSRSLERFVSFTLSRLVCALEIARENDMEDEMKVQLKKFWAFLESAFPEEFNNVLRKKMSQENSDIDDLLKCAEGLEIENLGSISTQGTLFLRMNHPSVAIRKNAYAQLATAIKRCDEVPDEEEFPDFLLDSCAKAVETELEPSTLEPLLELDPGLVARLIPADSLSTLVKQALFSYKPKSSVFFLPAMKAMHFSRGYEMAKDPEMVLRLSVFFLRCADLKVLKKIAELEFIASSPIFSAMPSSNDSSQWTIAKRVAYLKTGFSSSDGISALLDCLELKKDNQEDSGCVAVLYLIAAGILNKKLIGKNNHLTNSVIVKIAHQILLFLIRRSRKGVEISDEPAENALLEGTCDALPWTEVSRMASGVADGLRAVATSPEIKALLDRPTWDAFQSGSDAAALVCAWLRLLNFVFQIISVCSNVPGSSGDGEDRPSAGEELGAALLKTVGARPVWNLKAILVALRPRSWNQFTPSVKLKLRLCALLPLMMKTCRFSAEEEETRSNFLCCMAVSLIADPRRSLRIAGIECVEEILQKHAKKGGKKGVKDCKVTDPGWVFLLNGVLHLKHEIISSVEYVPRILPHAIKTADANFMGRRSFKTADTSSEKLIALICQVVQQRDARFYVRTAAVRFLEDLTPVVAAKGLLPLMDDILNNAISNDLDVTERVEKTRVMQIFLAAVCAPGVAAKEPEILSLFKRGISTKGVKCRINAGSAVSSQDLFMDAISKEFFCALSSQQQEEILEELVSAWDTMSAPRTWKRGRNALERILSDGKLASKFLAMPVHDGSKIKWDRDTSQQQEEILEELVSAWDTMSAPRTWKRGRNALERILSDGKLASKFLAMPVHDGSKIKWDRDTRRSKTEDPCSQEEWVKFQKVLEALSRIKSSKLSDAHLMIPVLFQRLEAILHASPKFGLEYTKQFCLRLLTKCCESCQLVGQKVTKEEFRVQVLDHVLHNVMSIFTFVGCSYVLQNHSFSFDILKQTMASIFPALLKGHGEEEVDATLVRIVRVFVAALKDIPPHWRIPLFHHMLEHVRQENYLWIVLGIFLQVGKCSYWGLLLESKLLRLLAAFHSDCSKSTHFL